MTMRRILILAVVTAGAGAAMIACGSSSDDLCEFSGTCPGASLLDGSADGDATVKPDGPIGDDGGADADADDGAPDVFIPPDAGPCGKTDDPYSGFFATDETGIFVSPTGGDAGVALGTKAKPFRLINDAIAVLSAGEPN